jgi:tetratricopeptide (TPR) repeat protein
MRNKRFAQRALLVVGWLFIPAILSLPPALCPSPPAVGPFALCPLLGAQQPVSRLKGRVLDERGQRLADAEVLAEAYFGPAAGTFAGHRTYRTSTNAKGEWTILGISPGVWVFAASAPGRVPEAVALPIRLLTPSGPNAAGQVLVWDLILKLQRRAPNEEFASKLLEAADRARAGRHGDATALLQRAPDDADAESLAAAGNIAVMAHDTALARALYQRALTIDPSSYRAALGIASTFLLARDFDSASRAFDAARSRTHDRDEIKFITFAIGDLQTISVR